MKSQAFTDYNQPLQEIETATPVPTGTEVVVKIGHCGVCHSDLHIHEGHFDMGGDRKLDIRKGRELPFTLGHEIEGEVIAVGPDAEGAKIGHRAAVYAWIGCGECHTCKRGHEELCIKSKHIGINVNGGFATHVVVPHPRYLIDYNGIPAPIAAAYMCSGLTAFGALKKFGELNEGERVLIVGLGGVGMMGLQFARAMFREAPLGADIDPAKLEAAKAAGAFETYNSKDPAELKRLLAETRGSVVGAVDFVGSEASLNFAQNAVAKGGKVVVVGLMGGSITIPTPMFALRVITLQGSFTGSLDDAREMMELARKHNISIPIEERPLSDANRTLDDLRNGKIIGRVVLKT